MFYYLFLLNTADHRGGTKIDPRDIIRSILVEVHCTMLHITYLSFNACCFGQEDFQRFYYIFLLKTADPRGGTNVDPRDIIGSILVEVHWRMLHTT